MTENEGQLMWSIVYVSLKDGADKGQWMNKYERDAVSIVDIQGYVQETYGPTIAQVGKGRLAALAMAMVILGVVILLFMSLMVEKERSQVSLMKALGFRNGVIILKYFAKASLPVLAGMLGGMLLTAFGGEKICGALLSSLGADGFEFVVCYWQAGLMLCLLLAVSAGAALAGCGGIKKIRAMECCVRKD